jgi:hypothetical protein
VVGEVGAAVNARVGAMAGGQVRLESFDHDGVERVKRLDGSLGPPGAAAGSGGPRGRPGARRSLAACVCGPAPISCCCAASDSAGSGTPVNKSRRFSSVAYLSRACARTDSPLPITSPCRPHTPPQHTTTHHNTPQHTDSARSLTCPDPRLEGLALRGVVNSPP